MFLELQLEWPIKRDDVPAFEPQLSAKSLQCERNAVAVRELLGVDVIIEWLCCFDGYVGANAPSNPSEFK